MTLTILGATGYTGRLCAREAVERGLSVRVAGRRRDALARLAEDLRDRATGPVETVTVDVGDGPTLRGLAASSQVLLSTVGPYERWGRPVVEAALAGGCAYVDVSGEVAFLEWVHKQDARARAAGVALCPGMGFDGVPGDLLAALAADLLDADPTSVRVAYALRGGRVSAGTAASAAGVAAAGGAAWRHGRLVGEPVGVDSWRAPLPQGHADALSVPLPEVVTVGRTTGAEHVRSYLTVPFASLIAPLAPAADLLRRVLATTPLLDGLAQGARRLPEGPSAEQRARTRATVVAEVRSGQRTAVARAHLRDVYLTTARTAVAVAGRLLEGGSATGALTPTSAVGGEARWLLQRMQAVVDVDDEPRLRRE